MQSSSFVTYQLLIEVSMPVQIPVGKLGEFTFPAGRYVYTGSARRNIEARIARHLSADKKLRWHIDYLLADSQVQVIRVMRSVRAECVVHQATPGDILIDGFGASDCRAGCRSHLKRVDSENG